VSIAAALHRVACAVSRAVHILRGMIDARASLSADLPSDAKFGIAGSPAGTANATPGRWALVLRMIGARPLYHPGDETQQPRT
jgi:hypothetical protein